MDFAYGVQDASDLQITTTCSCLEEKDTKNRLSNNAPLRRCGLKPLALAFLQQASEESRSVTVKYDSVTVMVKYEKDARPERH